LDTSGFFNLYIISDTKVAFGIKDQIDHYDDEQPVVTRNEAALNLYKKCDLQLIEDKKNICFSLTVNLLMNSIGQTFITD
jgi:hypothetical protein